VYGIDHQWQADLVDLAKLSSYNTGFNRVFQKFLKEHDVQFFTTYNVWLAHVTSAGDMPMVL
jgi:hypothetical protein